MIGEALKSHIEKTLTQALNQSFSIESVVAQGGGSINETYQIKNALLPLFLKINSASKYPEMFDKEAEGLMALASTNTLLIPKPIVAGVINDSSYLVMSMIQSGSPGLDFWDDFGKKLADLHKVSVNYFGFESDNYIGSLKQSNNKLESWPEFFVQERLEPLVKIAYDSGRIDAQVSGGFEKLYTLLLDYFPKEPASLLHGDLWSGNFMADENGFPVIYDPAVYYGHREMDIAMSKLFGGFEPEFYAHYNEHYPMENGWQNRMEVCNLYPLMVHVILFGGAYAQDVQSILRRMV